MRKIISLILLTPLSLLWGQIYRFRRAYYSYLFKAAQSFKVPVISVGNISFGGTGKTPFTIWLINYINSKNKKSLVLSRGYKGKFEHSSALIKQEEAFSCDPNLYGDEPLILAKETKKGAIAVGKDRIKNLKKYFAQVGPDIVLLDDGFQYLPLSRDINIVLFDATMDLSRYKSPPLGYLREGLRSLIDADIIAFTRTDLVGEEKIIQLKELIKKYARLDAVYLESVYTPTGLYNGQFDLEFETHEIRGKRVIAICGLASPNSFYQMLETMGANVTGRISLRDHHNYSRKELLKVLSFAEEEGALIITTEKDMIKIRKLMISEKLLFLKVKVDFQKGEQELKEKIDHLIG